MNTNTFMSEAETIRNTYTVLMVPFWKFSTTFYNSISLNYSKSEFYNSMSMR